jgi:hypothetical protein
VRRKGAIGLTDIHWVIAGGESGPSTRPKAFVGLGNCGDPGARGTIGAFRIHRQPDPPTRSPGPGGDLLRRERMFGKEPYAVDAPRIGAR